MGKMELILTYFQILLYKLYNKLKMRGLRSLFESSEQQNYQETKFSKFSSLCVIPFDNHI